MPPPPLQPHQLHLRLRLPLGVGPLTALAMVATYQRAQFRNDDVFIAIIGMDVPVRESGQGHGRRKRTKKGEVEQR